MRRIIRTRRGSVTLVASKGKMSISNEGCEIGEIPISEVREALDKVEEYKIIAKAEKLRALYKTTLAVCRGDEELEENRDKYLALQGVLWEAIQEIRQELLFADGETQAKLLRLLERIEDSNHRLDAILATRLGVMGPVATEVREWLAGGELPEFLNKEKEGRQKKAS